MVGCYEFWNKGVDMFIEFFVCLNYCFKSFGSKIIVVVFIIMFVQIILLIVEVFKGQVVIKLFRDIVDMIECNIGRCIFECFFKWYDGELMFDDKEIFISQDCVLFCCCFFVMKRYGFFFIVMYNMINDSEDFILNQICWVQFFNYLLDCVKIIFYLEFLNFVNLVFLFDYDDFVCGIYLGVFVLYYELWGYMLVECIVMGVFSIIINFFGFGCYMEELIENLSDYGIYIVDCCNKGVDDLVNQFILSMFDFI